MRSLLFFLFAFVTVSILLETASAQSCGCSTNQLLPCKSCGNGICEVGETPCSCPLDCSGCCPDRSCRPDYGETNLNCPDDCAVDIQVNIFDSVSSLPLTASNITCYSSRSVAGPVRTGRAVGYTFRGQFEDVWTCRAEKVGYVPGSGSGLFVPPYKCATQAPINIALVPLPICIFGEVYDADTQTPIEGARAICASNQAFKFTDRQGRFFYERLPTGQVSCSAQATGYLTSFRTTTLTFGDKKVVRLYLNKLPGNVNGTFADSKNLTALSASVVCTDRLGKTFSNPFELLSFFFRTVASGPITCTAFKQGFYPSTLTGVVPLNGTLTLRFLLVEFFGNLKGRIIDGRTGGPIPNAVVECHGDCGDNGTALTDINGNYLITGLKEGNYMCMPMRCGWDDGWDSQRVTVNNTATLNFVLLAREAVLSGRVYEYVNSGNPVANATVECRASDGRSLQVRKNVTDANGNFRVGELYGFGDLTCTFSKTGYRTSGRDFCFKCEDKISCDITMVRL